MRLETLATKETHTLLANAISEAFFSCGLPVDEAACVAVAVIADYARAEYGEVYLQALAAVVLQRGECPLPPATERH